MKRVPVNVSTGIPNAERPRAKGEDALSEIWNKDRLNSLSETSCAIRRMFQTRYRRLFEIQVGELGRNLQSITSLASLEYARFSMFGSVCISITMVHGVTYI